MKCKITKVWEIQVPWGKMTLTSWGEPEGQRVFLCHGRQDTSATFQPILDLIEHSKYYFVAMDLPGSGKSDPFPKGVKIMRFHFLAALEASIEHLGWEKFIFIAHSMGCELGVFYNAIYPGKMTKMILFDAELTLRRLQVHDLAEYQAMFYDKYYNDYQNENFGYKTYTIPEAKAVLMRNRNLTEEKASLILKDNLIYVGDDKYRFTWDRRLHLPAAPNYPNTYYFGLFKNIPPTLLIAASQSIASSSKYKDGARELIKMLATLPQFHEVVVEGDHDVHLSHPERLVKYVNDFLNNNKILDSKL